MILPTIMQSCMDDWSTDSEVETMIILKHMQYGLYSNNN